MTLPLSPSYQNITGIWSGVRPLSISYCEVDMGTKAASNLITQEVKYLCQIVKSSGILAHQGDALMAIQDRSQSRKIVYKLTTSS